MLWHSFRFSYNVGLLGCTAGGLVWAIVDLTSDLGDGASSLMVAWEGDEVQSSYQLPFVCRLCRSEVLQRCCSSGSHLSLMSNGYIYDACKYARCIP